MYLNSGRNFEKARIICECCENESAIPHYEKTISISTFIVCRYCEVEARRTNIPGLTVYESRIFKRLKAIVGALEFEIAKKEHPEWWI